MSIGSSETSVELCVALCKKWEGLKLDAYLCPAGVPTVGWGATGPDVKLGMTVTLEWAEQRIRRDVLAALSEAQRLSGNLKQYPRKHAAIGSFIYNLGSARYRASTLKKRVDEERWDEAVTEIQRWNKAGGRVLKGLVLRRAEEARLLQQ